MKISYNQEDIRTLIWLDLHKKIEGKRVQEIHEPQFSNDDWIVDMEDEPKGEKF